LLPGYRGGRGCRREGAAVDGVHRLCYLSPEDGQAPC
jgi:hypothetical protein